MTKIKVLIVDDHEMVRMGLRMYLETEEDFEIVGEAANGEEGLLMIEERQPDVVLMDIVMDTMDGIAATKEALRRAEQSKQSVQIIALTSFLEDQNVVAAVEAGAIGFLLKTAKANEIAKAIRNAYRGESTIEQQAAGALLKRVKQPRKKHDALTRREREVLSLIGRGKSNQEIADELHIGIKTVKTHVSHILEKLEVEDRTQAAIYAVNEKLTE